MLRYEPDSFAAKSGHQGLTQHSQLVTKAINARNHGAKAVILVNGKLADGEEDPLMRFGGVSGPENAGIMLLQVKNAVAESWFKAAGKSLADVQQQINQQRQAGIVRLSRNAATVAERRYRGDARASEQRAGLSARQDAMSTSSSARTTITSAAAIPIRWRLRRSGRFIPAPTTTPRARPACWNWRACSRR